MPTEAMIRPTSAIAPLTRRKQGADRSLPNQPAAYAARCGGRTPGVYRLNTASPLSDPVLAT
jgi:hypothetical protein